MSNEETKKMAQHHHDIINRAFSTGNFDLLDEVAMADFIEHNSAPGQGPGLAGWKQSLAQLRANFPDMQVAVQDIIAEGDKAVARVIWSGTHTGDSMGIPPTNKLVTVDAIDILRFQGGKVVEHWGVYDQMGVMQQLGMIPMQGPSGS